MLHADLTLARRLEAAEAAGRVAMALAHARLHPHAGAAALAIADGFAVFHPLSTNSTAAFGLGLHGPVADADLDSAEGFFRGRGLASRVQLCPLADPSLPGLLGRRGYRLAEWTSVLARPLGPPPPADGAGPLEVRQVDPADADLWAEVVTRGYSGRTAVTPAEREWGTLAFHLSTVACFLCRLAGEPAGAAAVAVHEGVATLFAAGTLPAFRRRGVQAGLLRARLAHAAAAGCDLATTGTEPGSTSQRNAERQGFQVAYTRGLMVRSWV
jgi:hypothetical protein